MLKLHVTIVKKSGETESFEYPFKYDNYNDVATELTRAEYILGKYDDKIKSVTITQE